MTARIVLSCDGARHGMACRGALPTRTVDADGARGEGRRKGWLCGPPDLCPACARPQREAAARVEAEVGDRLEVLVGRRVGAP